MSNNADYVNIAEREYTDAERLMAGLYAIEHLIDNYQFWDEQASRFSGEYESPPSPRR